jgi:hypothetical protein
LYPIGREAELMRREDIEKPRPKPKSDRVTSAPLSGNTQMCPKCARAGKNKLAVYGKTMCIDHLAEQAEGMHLEKVMQTGPVKARKRLPGALS